MRPKCLKCGREMIVTTSRADAGLRTQYFGCRLCGNYGGKPNVITMANASSTKMKNSPLNSTIGNT